MPSLYDAESKKVDIDKAKTYQYSEAELDDVLKEKKKFRQAPTNYAVAKTKLWKEIVSFYSVQITRARLLYMSGLRYFLRYASVRLFSLEHRLLVAPRDKVEEG